MVDRDLKPCNPTLGHLGVDGKATSPLWQAVNSGDLRIANALLGRGVEIGARERELLEHLDDNAPLGAAHPHRRVLALAGVFDDVDDDRRSIGGTDEAAPSLDRVQPHCGAGAKGREMNERIFDDYLLPDDRREPRRPDKLAMVAATRAAAEHATERHLEHAGRPIAFDASALDVDVGALKRIFAEHFADDGPGLDKGCHLSSFLTCSSPSFAEVLRALRPLIEKVGLESDLDTLFARDGETGVVRASLVRYRFEDLLLEEGGAAPKLSPHHDHLERPGVAATLLFTLQAALRPPPPHRRPLFMSRPPTVTGGRGADAHGFIPFGGQGSSLAPPGSGHRACIGQHAAGSALIFRRLVNGIYQHYVEGAAPKVLKQVGGLLRTRGEAVMPRDVVALWLPDAGAAAADPDIGRSGSFAAGCDAPAMAEREHRLMLPLAERLKAEGTATFEFGAIATAREAALGGLLPAARAHEEEEEAARAEAEAEAAAAAEGRRGPNISLGTRWSEVEEAVARGEADKARAAGGTASRSEVAGLVAARCPGRTWNAAIHHLTSHSIY